MLTGGAEAPKGLDRGYYVQPTIFSGDNTSREVQPRYVDGADTYVLHGGASICRVAGMFTGSPPNSPLSGTVNATGRSS